MRPGASKRIAVSGTVVALLLVAGLGNQWVFKEVWGDNSDRDKWYMVLLRSLGYPLWIADKGDFEHEFHQSVSGKLVTSGYVGGVLLLVVVAAVLTLGARGLGERAGGFAAFVLGWFAMVLGGVAYSLMVFAIAHDSDTDARGDFETLLNGTRTGAHFGLLIGWLVGLATALVYASVRRSPGGGGYAQPNAYGPPVGYGAPAAPGYGVPAQSPYDAPTTIRPAGPPPTAPPRPTGAPDTPPGGYRP